MEIFEKIKLFRTLLGLSQERVALYLDLKRPNYNSAERGKNKFSVMQLEKLAFLFGVTFDWLAENKKDKNIFKNKVNLILIPHFFSLRERNLLLITSKELLSRFLKDCDISKVYQADNIIIYYLKTDQLLILSVPKFLAGFFDDINNSFNKKKITIELLVIEPNLDNYFSFFHPFELDTILTKAGFPVKKILHFGQEYIKEIETDEFSKRTKLVKDLRMGFIQEKRREWEFNCKIKILRTAGISEEEAAREVYEVERLYNAAHSSPLAHISLLPRR